MAARKPLLADRRLRAAPALTSNAAEPSGLTQRIRTL
jgi:hypothetical protein